MHYCRTKAVGKNEKGTHSKTSPLTRTHKRTPKQQQKMTDSKRLRKGRKKITL